MQRLSLVVVLMAAASSASAAPIKHFKQTLKPRETILDEAPMRPLVQFDNLTIEEGLQQGQVVAITQDPAGFMWFGTRDGLQRFDGVNFTLYKYDPENPEGLADSIISGLVFDLEGNLWIGTWAGGLTRLDPATSVMKTFRTKVDDPEALSADSIGSLLLDAKGFLWVGTLGGGLNRLDRASGKFKRYQQNIDDEGSLSSDYVLSLEQSADGTLWVGTENGLNRMAPGEEKFTVFLHDEFETSSISNNTVQAILEDTDGNLWIGTNAGLNKLDRQREVFTVYKHDPKDFDSVSDDRIMSLLQDSRGTIWVGTEYGGVNAFDPKTGKFERYTYDRADPNSFGHGNVFSSCEDREGSLWFGTVQGVSRLDPTRMALRVFKHSPEKRNTLSHNSMHVFSERDGVLWMGTPLGIDRLALRGGQVKHFPILRVRSVFADANRRHAWVGAEGKGLFRLNGWSNWVRHFEFDPEDPNSVGGDTIQVIHPAVDGKLWLGLWGKGFDLFDPVAETFEHFPFDSLENDLPSGFISGMHATKDGKTLWLATLQAGEHVGGLAAFDIGERTFKVYKHDPKVPGSISDNFVLTVFEDSRGIVWAGTNGSGLNRLDPGADKFKLYTTKHGLPNDVVYGVMEDKANNLWISTNQGLAHFDPRTERFSVYTVLDGLPRNEFIQGSYAQGSEYMYFGTMDGAVVFKPEEVTRNTYVPPVLLTGLTKFNKPVALGKPLRTIDELEFTHEDYVFGFQFAALSFRAPMLNRYAYMLEGFDKEWVDAGQSRFATYTNLDGGSYSFRVKAANNHGTWNEKGAGMQLLIHPPPWKTWWAYTLYAVAAIGMVLLYLLYLRFKHRREMETQALQKDLELTGAVQSLFLPRDDTFRTDKLCVAGYYRPATHSSGDWWWYEPRPDGSMLILVGDVTGHGAGPAMVTASIASGFRTLEAALGMGKLDPGRILSALHDNMQKICRDAFSMTVSMLYIDPSGSNYKWWCAGSPPIFVRGGENLNLVVGSGTPLGSAGELQAQEKTGTLSPGDKVIIFTDGVSELTLENGKQLGLKKLRAMLSQQKVDVNAEGVRSHMSGELLKILGTRAADDDITFVIVERLTAAARNMKIAAAG